MKYFKKGKKGESRQQTQTNEYQIMTFASHSSGSIRRQSGGGKRVGGVSPPVVHRNTKNQTKVRSQAVFVLPPSESDYV